MLESNPVEIKHAVTVSYQYRNTYTRTRTVRYTVWMRRAYVIPRIGMGVHSVHQSVYYLP